jgi:TonB family protein
LGSPPACEEAGRVLLAASLWEDFSRPGLRETLLVVLEADALSCLAEAQPPEPQTARGEREAETPAGRIKEPKKTRHVDPRYPPRAKQAGIEGDVVLEANVSPTGCVRSMRLVRGDPDLGWESMRAVSQWRFRPALLDGNPVPLAMTVTVTYRLR